MKQTFIEKIQKRVIDLLLTLSDDLAVASGDQCSEMARLVGCWILESCPGCTAQILKGKLEDNLSHDVLMIKDGSMLFLIDPTIWQIFPKSSSIFIGSVGSVLETINLLQKKYDGVWVVSEIMEKWDIVYQKELLEIIKDDGIITSLLKNRNEIKKCYGK